MNFVNGDIVIFRQDTERSVWKLVDLSPHGDETQVRILLLPESSNPHAELAYTRLLTLAEPLMQFFRFGHLPQALQERSQPFWELANKIVVEYPRNPERTVALRKLLESKDAAVRSTIYQG